MLFPIVGKIAVKFAKNVNDFRNFIAELLYYILIMFTLDDRAITC